MKFYNEVTVRGLGDLPEDFRYKGMEVKGPRFEIAPGALDSVYWVTLIGTSPSSAAHSYLWTPLVVAAVASPVLGVFGLAGSMVGVASVLMVVAVVSAAIILTTRGKERRVKCRFAMRFPYTTCEAINTRGEEASLKTLREAFAHNTGATYDAVSLLGEEGSLPDEVASRARAAITTLAEQGERHRTDAARPEVQQAYAKLHQLEAAVDLEQ